MNTNDTNNTNGCYISSIGMGCILAWRIRFISMH